MNSRVFASKYCIFLYIASMLLISNMLINYNGCILKSRPVHAYLVRELETSNCL